MTDLTELLREMTDDDSAVRGDALVFERATAAARPLRRRRRARRAIAGATTLAVVIATAVVVAGHRSTDTDVRVEITTPPVTAPGITAADLRDGHWALIPAAPVPARGKSVWTGRELIMWGGAYGKDGDTLSGAGAAYDPATRAWRTLPPAPISARADNAAVWTGSEMIVWGGYTNGAGTKTNDGAAYSPATNRWRVLPPAPLAPQANTVAVWTGTRALFLSNGDDRAAEYDPATNRWVAGPAPPLPRHTSVRWSPPVALGTSGAALAWADWENVVRVAPNASSGTSGAVVVEYDARSNRWRALALPGDAIKDPHEALWTGHAVLVRGDDRTCLSCSGPIQSETSASFDPSTNTWAPLPDDPMGRGPDHFGADDLSSVWTGDALWSFNANSEIGTVLAPGDASLYDAVTKTWSRLPRAPSACGGQPVWTGHEVLVVCQDADSNALPGNAAGIAWVAVDKTAALHQTADAYLHAHPKDHERGLYRFDDDDWMLVYDGALLPSPTFKWSAGGTLFRWNGTRWSSVSQDVSGTVDRCFTVTGSYIAALHQHQRYVGGADYAVAVAFNPSWNFQERAGGTWQTVHTVNGVYFAIRPSRSTLDDGHLRPVDAHGQVPACYADERTTPNK